MPDAAPVITTTLSLVKLIILKIIIPPLFAGERDARNVTL
jgi:hypothetical protein